MALVLTVGCAGGIASVNQVPMFGAWILLSGGLFVLRKEMFQSRLLTLLLIAGATCCELFLFIPSGVVYHSLADEYGYPWLMIGWSVVLCAAALLVGRWRWMLHAWASLVVGIGAAVGITGLGGVLANQHWSRWIDPRWWDPHRQYPMLNSEAAWFGGGVLAIGVVMMLVVRRIGPAQTQSSPGGRT